VTAFWITILLLVLLAAGMPIALSMAIAGAAGIYVLSGADAMVAQISTTAYRTMADSTLAAIPLFVLMATLMGEGGMASSVFEAAKRIAGRLPGGVAIATVFASAGFAAVSGSSAASTGTLAAISLPEFKKLGYGLSAATGIVAVAGTLAVMIPPSIAFIIYGVLTETSIGKLLIAGIIPGLLTAFLYSLGIYVWARLDPKTLPRGERWTWRQKWEALSRIGGFCIIIFVTFFSLYGGIATATEVAAIGALATLIYLFVTGRIGFRGIVKASYMTLNISAMIMLIVLGAMVYGYFLTISRAPQDLIDLIGHKGLSGPTVLAIVLVIYFILGCLMDELAILLITLPITFPLVTSFGYDAIWYGVIIVKMVQFGLVCPPVGLNVFVVSATTGVPVGAIYRGTGYMLIFEGINLILLLTFPILSLWLPSLM
jgi:tripartite ATP-independent transporter DctM subunit